MYLHLDTSSSPNETFESSSHANLNMLRKLFQAKNKFCWYLKLNRRKNVQYSMMINNMKDTCLNCHVMTDHLRHQNHPHLKRQVTSYYLGEDRWRMRLVRCLSALSYFKLSPVAQDYYLNGCQTVTLCEYVSRAQSVSLVSFKGFLSGSPVSLALKKLISNEILLHTHIGKLVLQFTVIKYILRILYSLCSECHLYTIQYMYNTCTSIHSEITYQLGFRLVL